MNILLQVPGDFHQFDMLAQVSLIILIPCVVFGLIILFTGIKERKK